MGNKLVKTAAIIGGGFFGGPIGTGIAVGTLANWLLDGLSKSNIIIDEAEARFRIALLYATAIVDGNVNDQEKQLLVRSSDEIGKKSTINKPIELSIFKDLDFNGLLNFYDSLKEKDNVQYMKYICEMANVDSNFNLQEKLLLHKCVLMFSGIQGTKLYLKSDTVSKIPFFNDVEILNTKKIKKKYSKTNLECSDSLFVLNPINSKELVPISNYSNTDFVKGKLNKVSELFFAHGAKSFKCEKLTSDYIDNSMTGNVSIGKDETFEATGSIGRKQNDYTFNQYKFVHTSLGKRSGYFARKRILKENKWLEYDNVFPNFIEFFNNKKNLTSINLNLDLTDSYCKQLQLNASGQIGLLDLISKKIDVEFEYSKLTQSKFIISIDVTF